jgi:hypothetical protein
LKWRLVFVIYRLGIAHLILGFRAWFLVWIAGTGFGYQIFENACLGGRGLEIRDQHKESVREGYIANWVMGRVLSR